ncbi:hypothetical protein [Candidatus Rickettsiella viridis]|nr:hypothetical protein [Candidatus Rickettsiella viridis]
MLSSKVFQDYINVYAEEEGCLSVSVLEERIPLHCDLGAIHSAFEQLQQSGQNPTELLTRLGNYIQSEPDVPPYLEPVLIIFFLLIATAVTCLSVFSAHTPPSNNDTVDDSTTLAVDSAIGVIPIVLVLSFSVGYAIWRLSSCLLEFLQLPKTPTETESLNDLKRFMATREENTTQTETGFNHSSLFSINRAGPSREPTDKQASQSYQSISRL